MSAAQPRLFSDRSFDGRDKIGVRATVFDAERFAGFQYALQTRQDFWPARPPALQYRIWHRPGMRFGHGHSHAAASRLDIVADEALRQFAKALHPGNQPRHAEPSWRRPFEDSATDMQAAIRRQQFEGAADPGLDFDGQTEEILSGKGRIDASLPYPFRRRRDVGDVDGTRFETCDVGHTVPPTLRADSL